MWYKLHHIISFWILSTGTIHILMSVLDAITSNSFGDFSPCPWISPLHCKWWFVMQPKVLGWAFVDLFISLSPALYSVLVSLVSSRHLGLLGLPAPFPQLGETTCSAWVPPPWPGNSLEAVSWACVQPVCFCLPGITVFCYLSSIFSVVVSFILLDFYYFTQGG